MVSIIIPTFNRNDLLLWGLNSLNKQIIPWGFEIIVLDEGLEGDCKKLCKNYKNVKYILTRPNETEKTIKWRVPTAAINIGVKLAKYPVIILTGPEIYHLNKENIKNLVEPLLKDPKLMTYTEGFDDKFSRILRLLEEEGDITEFSVIERRGLRPLNTLMPFCLGMKRNEFIDIGGYDEDFLGGYCFDDTDVVARMTANGCKYLKVPGSIIHLHHQRLRYGLEEVKELWKRNEKLYLERYGKIIRNEGKEWGVIK